MIPLSEDIIQGMHKRLLLVYAMIALLLVLLPACGGQDAGDETPSEPSVRIITSTPSATRTPTVTPTPRVPVLDPAALGDVSIELWYFWDPTELDALAQAVEWFNAENELGIQVSTQAFIHPVELAEAVAQAISDGSQPDVVLAEPYQYLPWFDAGEVVEISPYLESPAYGLDLEGFYPAIINRDVFSGSRLAFPGLFSAHVLMYNLNWAEELGFDSAPIDPEEFTEQACTARLANQDRTGGWMIDQTPAGAAAWLLAFDPNLQRRIDFKSEGVEAAYTFLAQLSSQGCAWQPTDSYPDQAFAERLGLFYTVSTRELEYVADAFEDADSQDEWRAIGYPNPEGEPVVSLSGRSYVLLEGEIESQVAGWLLVRYLVGEKIQAHLAETNLYLPLDRNTAARLEEDPALVEEWRQALDLLDQAVVEPPVRAWGVLRSVVQDAQAEVLDERFVLGTLSLFLDQLDKLADEFQNQ